MENKVLKLKYTEIALRFLKLMNAKYRIICALATGSYYTGGLTESSDLDMFLITDNSSKQRERGVLFFEGIKVSYFLNPHWKIIELLSSEKGKLKRPTAESVCFSKCFAGSNGELRKIAKKTLNSSTTKINKQEISHLGWKLYDKIEVFNRKNYAEINKEYLRFDLLNLSIDVFFLIKRSYRPHAKYTMDRIQVLDKIFYKKLKNFLKNKSDISLTAMVNYLSQLLKFEVAGYYKRTKTTSRIFERSQFEDKIH